MSGLLADDLLSYLQQVPLQCPEDDRDEILDDLEEILVAHGIVTRSLLRQHFSEVIDYFKNKHADPAGLALVHRLWEQIDIPQVVYGKFASYNIFS